MSEKDKHNAPIPNINNNPNINYWIDKGEELRKEDRLTFDQLKRESISIVDLSERIQWWHNKKVEYLNNLPINVIDSSGVITTHTYAKGELFLDRFITCEVETLIEQLELETKLDLIDDEKIRDIIKDSRKNYSKMIYNLDKFGIIKFIEGKCPNIKDNPQKFAELLFDLFAFKGHVDSIRQPLNYLKGKSHNPNHKIDSDKTVQEFKTFLQKYGIDKTD